MSIEFTEAIAAGLRARRTREQEQQAAHAARAAAVLPAVNAYWSRVVHGLEESLRHFNRRVEAEFRVDYPVSPDGSTISIKSRVFSGAVRLDLSPECPTIKLSPSGGRYELERSATGTIVASSYWADSMPPDVLVETILREFLRRL